VSETAFDDIVDRATPADAPLVTIPGVGPVRTGLVILIGLALLAIILLSAFGRRGRERRRAEQRQRARETRADFSPSADTAAAAPGERKAQATAADTGETETPNRKEPEPS
jgi:hypothetical protein